MKLKTLEFKEIYISLGIPLPFGNIKSNKRSFLSISNLNLLLLECSMSKKVIGKKILVRDDPMLSTTDLIKVFFARFKIKFLI